MNTHNFVRFLHKVMGEERKGVKCKHERLLENAGNYKYIYK
jgi:hypothetical protein